MALDEALLGAESDGQADPRTTSMGFVGVLRALAAERPVVVAVDDVQWLDRASERALEFAVRRLPPRVSFLVVRRSEGASDVPLGLTQAFAGASVERVTLGPLSAAALHHLIRNELGAAPPRPVLIRIESACGGNPFYALEIARALAREAGETEPGNPLPIPDNLQELVLARMRELSGAGRDAALVAAALSRPTVTIVAAALGPENAEAAIVEVEEAGIIVAERARIRFAHPLFASAVYAATSGERRRQLHGQLAEVVTDPEERGRHLAESLPQADSATAAEIDQAADRASRRGAQDAAAQLYGAAARLTPDDRPDDAAKRMLGQAAALFAAGDPTGARTIAEVALGRAASDTRRAEANLLLGEIAWVERPGPAQIDYLERALALANGGDRRLRGRIHARFAEAFLIDQRKALEHAEAAAGLLDEDEDPGSSRGC